MVQRILVLSDTHGYFDPVKNIIQEHANSSQIIHCGDYLYHGPRNPVGVGYDPLALAAFLKERSGNLVGVLGNCDSQIDLNLLGKSELPESRTITVGEVNLFVHHGHAPRKIPFEEGIVISGHTHIARLERENSLLFMNPGSPAMPKDGTGGTFGIIDFQHGKILLLDIKGNKLKEAFF